MTNQDRLFVQLRLGVSVRQPCLERFQLSVDLIGTEHRCPEGCGLTFLRDMTGLSYYAGEHNVPSRTLESGMLLGVFG